MFALWNRPAVQTAHAEEMLAKDLPAVQNLHTAGASLVWSWT